MRECKIACFLVDFWRVIGYTVFSGASKATLKGDTDMAIKIKQEIEEIKEEIKSTDRKLQLTTQDGIKAALAEQSSISAGKLTYTAWNTYYKNVCFERAEKLHNSLVWLRNDLAKLEVA